MLDLTCVTKELIGMLGSSYFITFAISAAIVPVIADKIGRKWPLFFSIVFQQVCWLFLFWSRSIYFSIACFFGVGLAAGGRVAICATYANEFVQAKHQSILTTCLLILDAAILTFQACIYAITPNWVPVHMFGFLGGNVLTVLLLFIPESPKFFYSHGRFDEARASLAKIAKINGK